MKKFLSGIILLLSLFSFWSCEKKEKENALEKELIGSWNYRLEHNTLYNNGQVVQPRDGYNGNIIFHNDNTFEYKLEPGYNLDTKGTWKAIDDQLYMYFYTYFHEYNGSYDIVREDEKLALHLVYKKNNTEAVSVQFKLTK